MTIEIYDWTELDAIRLDLSEDYVLMNDLDTSTYGFYPVLFPDTNWEGTWTAGEYEEDDLVFHEGKYYVANTTTSEEPPHTDWDEAEGWEPIGNSPNRFEGSFNGQNYTISNLFINRPIGWYIGLFGFIDTQGEVENVGIVDVYVSGYDEVGGLAGWNNGNIKNSYATGNVSGDWDVGGLVGNNYNTIKNSYATGNVSGNTNVGGLAGLNTGRVENSYAMGTVTRLSGTDTNLGGFVGFNFWSKIINCYSTGSVHYEGTTDPTDKGFVGSVDTGGDYEMTGNFWNVETSNQTSSAGEGEGEIEGKTTAEMKRYSTYKYSNWDIEFHDTEDEADGYPFLSWEID